MRVLVTGADGFVGRALVTRVAMHPECSVVAAVRQRSCAERGPADIEGAEAAVQWMEVGDLATAQLKPDLLSGVDVVVHCAARVHVMDEIHPDPLAAFRAVNVNGTLNLARTAARSGAKRFVFLSSVKVHGESTSCGPPFTDDDALCPVDPYAVSKMEAERALLALSEKTGLEVVIIRPPLVYGPGVKANFYSMMRWLDKGIPLPLGAIRNRRSLVALDNLADLIMSCLAHPNAAGQAFLVSDGEDLSTTELLRRLGEALGKPARLIPVPPRLLERAGALLGKRAVMERICGSLQVDIEKSRLLLGWVPPVSVDSAIASTAAAFVAEHSAETSRT
ncbi:NAD-dependent dehydratase [Stutzerimonas stutzeri]|uniref:NAD-dependent dehydratase n=1 Tax=Stutzerimonas stutzeri TaxID=316 RepID=W8RVM7_STUST|nr:SDR family oxidoreductase [Stutzerimonas stutzeri]AHL76126.1 NAD-dependent dehydratase [Stutzerimonas stutzeri]MCQ4330521.1 SDR family oxidoreductase [Stutzerimonas stutzeri]